MPQLLRLVHILLLVACAAAQLQAPLSWHTGASSAPTRLSAVGNKEFTTLSHPAFPKHAVRISRVDGFCDTTVGQVA
jgi:hypothetical protein